MNQMHATIPGDVYVLSQRYASGATVVVPVGTLTFTLSPYTFDIAGGISRQEVATVSTSTTLLEFEWITADVQIRVVNQNGIEIPASSISAFGTVIVPSGSTYALPITDATVYPTIGGIAAGGYPARINPGVLDYAGWLQRDGGVRQVLAGTTDLVYEWITSDVMIRVENQNGIEIPGSSISVFNTLLARSGTRYMLPITDATVYPTIGGIAGGGYPARINPGVLGGGGWLYGDGGVRQVDAQTTDLAYEWMTSDVEVTVRDQYGVEIAGSTVSFFGSMRVASGDTCMLPVTDPGVYPTMSGPAAGGYPALVNPGVAGARGWLYRQDPARPVLALTTQLAYEWTVVSCPLFVANEAGVIVAGSSVVLPAPFPAYTLGQPIRLPITENATYPTISGVFENGYPIKVRPGDIQPAEATYEFEVSPDGILTPALFTVGGNRYRLLAVCNIPPTSDAGDNRTIASSAQSTTTINGVGQDANGDPLTYTWLEGTTVLLGPVSVLAGGLAPLALSGVPTLGPGEHELTLQVSDGLSTAVAKMVLTVADSPPTVSCYGGGTYQVGLQAIQLGGSVADFDGGCLSFEWRLGSSVVASGTVSVPAGGDPVTLPVTMVPTSSGLGAIFGPGEYDMELVVSDGVNPAVVCHQQVSVIDSIAPTISPVSDTPILWPPNHQLVNVLIAAHAADANGGPVLLEASVASSEDPDKDGDGHTIPDYFGPVIDQVTGTIAVQLRAERSGKGKGRTYVIKITATDASLNMTRSVVTVEAPHSR
ncbi:MAG: hypothetical protein U1E73_05590 [Planctomycetota bacterium]